MNLNLIQGQLVRWEDDRGFGFIQPDDGGANVFVHISAIDRAIRRPKVGDRLSYTVQTQKDGKIRAVDARLLGIPPPPVFHSPAYDSTPFDWFSAVKIVVGLAVLGAFFFWNSPRKDNRSQRSVATTTHAPSIDSGSRFVPDNDSTDFGGNMERQNGSSPPPGYTIKGNISVNNGKRYYHTPGMRDYDITVIDTNQGERWFRTEDEAVAAGWEQAKPYQGRNY